MRGAVPLAALVEIGAGLALLVLPALSLRLLLGLEAEAAGLVMTRFAGIALVSLGIAGLPGRQRLGLLVFNIAILALLVRIGTTDVGGGVLLWPLVALHLALSVLLGRDLLLARAGRSAGGSPGRSHG
jgi:hypothetical protein